MKARSRSKPLGNQLLESTAPAPRVLPADIYDTLEFMALVYGGIGAGPIYTRAESDDPCPICAHGLLQLADGKTGIEALDDFLYDRGVSDVLVRARLDGGTSDIAVETINLRKGRDDIYARVSFAEYRAETNIVRGD